MLDRYVGRPTRSPLLKALPRRLTRSSLLKASPRRPTRSSLLKASPLSRRLQSSDQLLASLKNTASLTRVSQRARLKIVSQGEPVARSVCIFKVVHGAGADELMSFGAPAAFKGTWAPVTVDSAAAVARRSDSEFEHYI